MKDPKRTTIQLAIAATFFLAAANLIPGDSAERLRAAVNYTYRLVLPSVAADKGGQAPTVSPPVQNPGDGPWNRNVVAYRSMDGLAFGPSTTAFERAGVPCVIRDHSGRLLAVFQWFPFDQRAAFDRVAVAISDDDGQTWTGPVSVSIAGMPVELQRPFDPTVVELPDGRLRLYFTSGVTGMSGPVGQGNVAIYSAISNDSIAVPGGINFRFEPGARFAPVGGTVDAAVVAFGGAWHLFAHNLRPNTGEGYYAVSQDGLEFTQQPNVTVGQGRQWIGNAVLTGELLRYYGSGVDGVWSATSRDGAHWLVEPGVRAQGGDASVVTLPNGETLMLVVGPLRADAGPSPF